MPATDTAFIAIEGLLVLGGALAFGWWQLRDLAREQRAAEKRRQQILEQQQQPGAAAAAVADPSQPVPPNGDAGLVEPPCRSCTDPRVG